MSIYSFDFQKEEDIKQYIHNIGIEYRFGCYKEKRADSCHLLADYITAFENDLAKADKLYKINCDKKSYSLSCMKHAFNLEAGRGVEKDVLQALPYFEKACELNEYVACQQTAHYYLENRKKKKRIYDPIKGYEYLKKACLEGEMVQSCVVGAKLAVDCEDNKDAKASLPFLEKACRLGDFMSCYNIGVMYHKGQGVEVDKEKSKEYVDKARELREEIRESAKSMRMNK